MNVLLPTSKKALVAAVEAGSTFAYFFFWGHRKSADGTITKSCFSQWYEAAFRVDEELYRTAEHYMMVRKARLFSDETAASAILASATADEAKSHGRKVRGFAEERWLEHREEIVFAGNVAKFTQNNGLKQFLLSTGASVLAEASPVDLGHRPCQRRPTGVHPCGVAWVEPARLRLDEGARTPLHGWLTRLPSS